MLGSEVHPIDNNSVPYNFSSSTSPLLNNTARALNLSARSQKSYLSVFGLPASSASVMSPSRASSSSTSTSHGTSVPPLDDKYTGHILVSGYNISYVLPKEFPPRFGEDSAIRFSTAKMRRGSVGERNNMNFMAGIDLWVPYVSRPPKAPYLVRRLIQWSVFSSYKCSINTDIHPSSALFVQQHQTSNFPSEHYNDLLLLRFSFLCGGGSWRMGAYV